MPMSSLSLSPTPSQPSSRRQNLQPVPPGVPETRHISSKSLLKGARELVIQHECSEYHLRLTRNDKLILTK
ncbi:MAG: hemin uptake protein HemP [Pseudomonadota bacterium]|nr:hemin uptake protein HemP [Pseudomonadota bacterium]